MNLRNNEIARKVDRAAFASHGLAFFLWVFFNSSPYLALRYTYPELKPWSMSSMPSDYWNGVRGKKKAVNALLKALFKSNYDLCDYPIIVSDEFIDRIGLSAPFKRYFKSNAYLFLDAAFPDTFKPWEMAVTPKGYFDEDADVAREAVRWLVEKRLNIDIANMSEIDVWHERVSKRINRGTFERNGLCGLLSRYDNSPERLVRMTYPGKFQEWDFPGAKKWKGEKGRLLAARATRWVIETYAKLEPTSADIGYRFFVENGLHGMITSPSLGFNSSPKKAKENAYPNHTF
jgi:hypothetical protein